MAEGRTCPHCLLPMDPGVQGNRVYHAECQAERRRQGDRSRRPAKARYCDVCMAVEVKYPTRSCEGCRDKSDQVRPPIRCKKCNRVKAASSFSNDSTRDTGKFPYCKKCQVATTSKFQNEELPLNGNVCPWDEKPIRGHRNRIYCSETCKGRIKKVQSYGLSVVQYKSLLASTGGRCPICLKRATKWNIDHNHKTKAVTGLVCTRCNVGALAATFHDIEFVIRLFRYLKETPAERLGIHALVQFEDAPSNLHKMWFRKS